MSKDLLIFEFSDYRQFLIEKFNQIRTKKQHFSQRYIANKLGYKSTGAISLILNGRKNISIEKAIQISEFIKLSKEEADYFQLLVQFNQAKNKSEKTHFYQKLSNFETSQFSQIDQEQYDFFNNWYHSVIREVIGIHPHLKTADDICAIIKPRVTVAQVEKSLLLLSKLGFITKNDNGYYKRCEQIITTGKTIDSAILKKYNYDMIRLALNTGNKQKDGNKMLSSLMLGVSEKTYFKMIDEIRDLRKRLLKMAQEEETTDRVYQFNFQTFPLTNKV